MAWLNCDNGMYINTDHITHVKEKNFGIVGTSLFEVFLVNGACVPIVWNASSHEAYDRLATFLLQQTTTEGK